MNFLIEIYLLSVVFLYVHTFAVESIIKNRYDKSYVRIGFCVMYLVPIFNTIYMVIIILNMIIDLFKDRSYFSEVAVDYYKVWKDSLKH